MLGLFIYGTTLAHILGLMWGVWVRRIFITILAFGLVGCGQATISSDDPDDSTGPTAIGFNKSVAAPDVSVLSSIPSELVAEGASVCSVAREIFVRVMGLFDGISVERDTELHSFDAEVDGIQIKIDFTAWGNYGCSGNTAQLPVCYAIRVNNMDMLQGVILVEDENASGETGEIVMNIDPEGTGLLDISAGGVSISAQYDTTRPGEPTILLGVDGDMDGAGDLSQQSLRCRISRERLNTGAFDILLEMASVGIDGEVMFAARSDGITASVKIEGGDFDTAGESICISGDGKDISPVKDASATTTASGGSSCGSLDVSGLAFTLAP